VTILVTGASGNIGRPLVEMLVGAGADVRAFSRRGTVLPTGVEVVLGDLADASSVEPALSGVTAAFLLWPQATALGHAATVDLVASRVPRVVYLSSVSVETMPHHPFTVIHGDIERRIRAASDAWTFVRVGKLDTNALAYVDEIRERGEVRLPYPGVGRAPIHERDVAAVVARLLLDERSLGEAIVPSGPESMTEADIVGTIGEAIGREIRVTEISPAEARADMLAEGIPPDLADAALAYWRRLVEEPEPRTEVVRELTGLPAATFASWAADHATAFA
jgi:uncharacterized protein YbjT (DUF2867 family)